jgi:hypothetical protein
MKGKGKARAAAAAPDGKAVVVDGAVGVAGGVFDGTADQTRSFPGKANRLADDLRGVAVSVLEVGGDGQIGGVSDGLGVGQRLGTAHACRAIAPAQRKGEACASGGESQEAETGENASGSDVPGVADDEGFRSLVKSLELCGFFCLGRHDLPRAEMSKNCLVAMIERQYDEERESYCGQESNGNEAVSKG